MTRVHPRDARVAQLVARAATTFPGAKVVAAFAEPGGAWVDLAFPVRPKKRHPKKRHAKKGKRK